MIMLLARLLTHPALCSFRSALFTGANTLMTSFSTLCTGLECLGWVEPFNRQWDIKTLNNETAFSFEIRKGWLDSQVKKNERERRDRHRGWTTVQESGLTMILTAYMLVLSFFFPGSRREERRGPRDRSHSAAFVRPAHERHVASAAAGRRSRDRLQGLRALHPPSPRRLRPGAVPLPPTIHARPIRLLLRTMESQPIAVGRLRLLKV